MPEFVNIAAYRFARMTGLKPLRERLLARCKEGGLKGTILLSTEGVNLFAAGSRESVGALVAELRSIPGLEDLPLKESVSDHQPFNRMLVRIKKEIIAFGVEGIDPGKQTSPKLPAATLKQWLDEGRPITLLDTRNDYEVKLGTFHGALPIGIDHFKQFPDAVGRLPAELKKQPIVMFCTGGIRCEKAGPYMEREGFEMVYQLEGGILKYFEECGGEHYHGECFVFDQRVGVDPALKETETAQCFQCQTPLSAGDQRDPRFVASESCPYCYKDSAERQALQIEMRQSALQQAATPLPGSQPHDNFRPLNIPADCDSLPLIDALCRIVAHVPRDEWLRRCKAGEIIAESGDRLAETDPVRGGQRVLRLTRSALEPDVCADIRILHEDEAILVLNKPAPLPMHPGGRYERNTLQWILGKAYAPQSPRVVHRLDANTTGVVVLARTRHFAHLLQPQFSEGSVEKVYLVRVHGTPSGDMFSCDAAISDVPGQAGTRGTDPINGQSARTDFQVLSRFADGTSLLQAIPRTGRTNQIRVHLWHLGFPVLGDPAYLPCGEMGGMQTTAIEDLPMCLHAWRLTLTHPLTRDRLSFEAPTPPWTRE